MPDMSVRPMRRADWPAVMELIYLSTNVWYQTHGRPPIFQGGPESAKVFCQVYEDLDPGCCLLAEEPRTKRLMGSCFYHPRPTHVSLGIMNVHPAYFGRGVASTLLQRILAFADAARKPVRLVSSAMNLDSYSLYTRAGFVPQRTFQDMYLQVPERGLKLRAPWSRFVRPARPGDVSAIVALEAECLGIRRPKDWRYFIQNRRKIWHVSVFDAGGRVEGVLASVRDRGSNMLGPGCAREPQQILHLIAAELDQNRGRSPVFLIPVDAGETVAQLYAWGAKNCEIHVAQARGAVPPQRGLVMPSFMPETA